MQIDHALRPGSKMRGAGRHGIQHAVKSAERFLFSAPTTRDQGAQRQGTKPQRAFHEKVTPTYIKQMPWVGHALFIIDKFIQVQKGCRHDRHGFMLGITASRDALLVCRCVTIDSLAVERFQY